MCAFSPTMIEVVGGGHLLVREPVGFGGRVSEAKLEALGGFGETIGETLPRG
jgi:hypothetical protein